MPVPAGNRPPDFCLHLIPPPSSLTLILYRYLSPASLRHYVTYLHNSSRTTYHFHVLPPFILMFSGLTRVHQSNHFSRSSIQLSPTSHSLYCILNTITLCFFLHSKRLTCLSLSDPAYPSSSLHLFLPLLSGDMQIIPRLLSFSPLTLHSQHSFLAHFIIARHCTQ